jgi:TfoX/Sxy family transcriptional regulator of competence genes
MHWGRQGMKIKWKKNSPEMMAFTAAVLASTPGLKKHMFGGLAYFINGNMFAGLHQDQFFLRLAAAEREDLVQKRKLAVVLEPMPGRIMQEYVAFADARKVDKRVLLKYVDRSFEYAKSLKPKKK